MRFAQHLFRKNEWFIDQRWRLRQNRIGSKNVEFHFGTSDDRVIGSHRVNPIHDFSVADPFAKIVRFQNLIISAKGSATDKVMYGVDTMTSNYSVI